jgi:membrane protein DedA with SNARE-associated domain
MPISFERTTSEVAILVIVFFAQALKEMGIPSFGLTHSLLLYAGYQFSSGSPYLGAAIVLSTFLGSLCGASLIFYLARLMGDKLLAKLDRFGLIKPEAMAKAKTRLTKISFVTISIGRSIPGLMVPTSILAGILDFPVSSFLTGIIVTLSLWVVAIVTTGSVFKFFIPKINLPPDHLLFFLGPLVIFGLLLGVLYLRKKEYNI